MIGQTETLAKDDEDVHFDAAYVAERRSFDNRRNFLEFVADFFKRAVTAKSDSGSYGYVSSYDSNVESVSVNCWSASNTDKTWIHDGEVIINFNFRRIVEDNVEKQTDFCSFVFDGYNSYTDELVFRIQRGSDGNTFYIQLFTPEFGNVKFEISPKLSMAEVENPSELQLVLAQEKQVSTAEQNISGKFLIRKHLSSDKLPFQEFQDKARLTVNYFKKLFGEIEVHKIGEDNHKYSYVEVTLVDTERVFKFMNDFFNQIGVDFSTVGLTGIEDFILQLIQINEPSKSFQGKKEENNLYNQQLNAQVDLLAKLFDSTAKFTKMRRGLTLLHKALIGMNQVVRKAIPQSNQKQLSSSSD